MALIGRRSPKLSLIKWTLKLFLTCKSQIVNHNSVSNLFYSPNINLLVRTYFNKIKKEIKIEQKCISKFTNQFRIKRFNTKGLNPLFWTLFLILILGLFLILRIFSVLIKIFDKVSFKTVYIYFKFLISNQKNRK